MNGVELDADGDDVMDGVLSKLVDIADWKTDGKFANGSVAVVVASVKGIAVEESRIGCIDKST